MKRIYFFRLILIAIAMSGFTFMVFAQAVPPDLVNYQGILRDSSDNPLDGNYDMTFQFFNVDAGGQAILIDEHLAAGTGAVTVTNGLFNAHLGGGAVSDGPEPGGTYTTLTQVFRDYGNVYLEVKVYNTDTTTWETLSPRIRIISAAYALNTDHLDGTNSDQFLRSDTGDNFTSGTLTMDSGTTLDVNGPLQMDGSVTKATTDLVTNFNSDLLDGLHSSSFSLTGHTHPGSDITSPVSDASNADTLDGFDSTYFLNTSSSPQVKSGPLALDASGDAAFGIETHGQSGGGYFNDSDNSGFAYVGYGDRGIEAYGNEAGAYFADSSGFGYAYLGYSNSGIAAYGDVQGGYFKDTDSTGYARVGYEDTGISGYGDISGGYFADAETFPSGYAYVGKVNYGIEARGNLIGGYFKDADNSGYAYVGDGDYGISAWGNTAGGYFKDLDSTGYALVGSGDTGIDAYGNTAGGYFADSQITPSAYAYVGKVNYGIEAYGNTAGGYFKDLDHSGYAYVGYQDGGIQGYGTSNGGYFHDIDNSGEAFVGIGDLGISSYGNTAGGYFKDLDSGTYAYVADGTYKIYSNGSSSSFVQNHPEQKSQVIVYAAPEGDEVATYTRGTSRLVNGEAKVVLSETFQWVTNPDIGLTAHITPRSQASILYVDLLTTQELIVRSMEGFPDDVAFDYLVYGLRIGLEEMSVVQPKIQESYIPSMKDHREMYAQYPDLRKYNAFERFQKMHLDNGIAESLDLSASIALKNAIEEYDPAVHAPVGHERSEHELLKSDHEAEAQTQAPISGEGISGEQTASSGIIGDKIQSTFGTIPIDDEGNIHAKSFRSISPDLTGNVPISEQVEVGDVLVVDPMNPGMMRLGNKASDTAVVGIVAGEPGVVLGGSMKQIEEAKPEPEQQLKEESPAQEEIEVELPQTHAPVALSGIVVCKVDAGYGSIQIGDLLTTSTTKGHAMRSYDHAPGTIIGKALEPIDAGTGLIKVLVMMR